MADQMAEELRIELTEANRTIRDLRETQDRLKAQMHEIMIKRGGLGTVQELEEENFKETCPHEGCGQHKHGACTYRGAKCKYAEAPAEPRNESELVQGLRERIAILEASLAECEKCCEKKKGGDDVGA